LTEESGIAETELSVVLDDELGAAVVVVEEVELSKVVVGSETENKLIKIPIEKANFLKCAGEKTMLIRPFETYFLLKTLV
jgi:hypothetical protein